MRMGPFSNAKVVKYLNEFFVPVYTSNEDYLAGKKGREEMNLLIGIWADATKKKMSQGTVHAYLLTPNAEVIDSIHVRHAADTLTLMRFLATTVRQRKTNQGETLIAPRRQSTGPATNANELLLRANSHYLDRTRLPVEDWITLGPKEWKSFSPKKSTRIGEQWSINSDVARKVFVHLYPYAADWDVKPDQISELTLMATIFDRSPERTTIALRGKMSMIHNRQPGRDPQPLLAEIVGRVIIETGGKPQILITTGNATFAGRPFEALVTSVQESAPAAPDKQQLDGGVPN